MEKRVKRYCRLLEKEVLLTGKSDDRSSMVAENCSEEGCPMRRSLNCLICKVIEGSGR